MSTQPTAPRLHPMLWIAAISVTVVSMLGIASMTGLLPSGSAAMQKPPTCRKARRQSWQNSLRRLRSPQPRRPPPSRSPPSSRLTRKHRQRSPSRKSIRPRSQRHAPSRIRSRSHAANLSPRRSLTTNRSYRAPSLICSASTVAVSKPSARSRRVARIGHRRDRGRRTGRCAWPPDGQGHRQGPCHHRRRSTWRYCRPPGREDHAHSDAL